MNKNALMGLGGVCGTVVASVVIAVSMLSKHNDDEIRKDLRNWEDVKKALQILRENKYEISMEDWQTYYEFANELMKHDSGIPWFDLNCDNQEVNLYSKYYWCDTHYDNWEQMLLYVYRSSQGLESNTWYENKKNREVINNLEDTAYEADELMELYHLYEKRNESEVNKKLSITSLYYNNGIDVWKALLDTVERKINDKK